ncbi:MAG: zf-HC2 domain-containing protein [Rhizobacter sp.]|nr:zf-HC2 domain-containing protein [Chlorobiales bacterium]
MTTHPAKETLFEFLDGTLAPAESERVRGHLAQCETCQRDAAVQGLIASAIQLQPKPVLSREFTASVMARIVVKEEAPSFLLKALASWGSLAAVALTLIVMGFIALSITPSWMMPSLWTSKASVQNPSPSINKIVADYDAFVAEKSADFQRFWTGLTTTDADSHVWTWMLAFGVIGGLMLVDRYVVRRVWPQFGRL